MSFIDGDDDEDKKPEDGEDASDDSGA